MSIKIEAPEMGESISEATVATWNKKEGDFVNADELIAELETDKVNLEVTAPSAGKLVKILKGEGDSVSVGEVMGEIDESASGESQSEDSASEDGAPKEETKAGTTNGAAPSEGHDLSPAVRRLVDENNLNPAQIPGTGKGGRITKEDVVNFMESGGKAEKATTPPIKEAPAPEAPAQKPAAADKGEREERVPMSRLRKTIATRLKTAQNNAAMLTTYNEVDLSAVMAMRKKYQDQFIGKYDTKLGFMSFFTKAVIEGLKDWPALNAEIDGEEIVYKNYYDIGIAVASERGLVVPVVREADSKSFADIEKEIKDFGQRARKGGLKPDELTGSTFTITNGGGFGSMMSMPILNYPQVGILGMHAIKERPVVVDGEIVIRPMMYLALTYDHRIVDGKEAVSFLVKIKDCLEDPARLALGI